MMVLTNYAKQSNPGLPKKKSIIIFFVKRFGMLDCSTASNDVV